MKTPAIVISGIAAGVGTILLLAYAGGARELAQKHETAASLAAREKANAVEAKQIEMDGIRAGRKAALIADQAWDQRHANDPNMTELRRLEAEDRAALGKGR